MSFPTEKTERITFLPGAYTAWRVRAPGCEPREAFLGGTEKEGEGEVTGGGKAAGKG